MSNILKFPCKAPNCGRRFETQEGLNTHFKLRHPELKKNSDIKQKEEYQKEKVNENPSMEKIIKQISRTKLNEKHHILEPIGHKGLSSSTLNNIKRNSQSINPKKEKDFHSKIINKEINKTNLNNNEIIPNKNDFKENKKIKENNKKKKNREDKDNIKNENLGNKDIEEIEIPNIIEEKQKKLLNNLFSQINSLENYLDKDCEFHKQFEVPDVPDYDKMYDSDREEKEEENKKRYEKKKNNKNDKNKIYEITNEMVFKQNNNENKYFFYDDNKYKEIKEINLSKKSIINFKNNKNISFEKLSELLNLNLSYNEISELNDIIFFENLKELYINNNKIEDISFCESLPNLLILNAENNNIITITSLNICTKLKALKLSNNKIKYLNSTLKTIKNLKNIEDLSIKENPFLSELFSYREYFISNYPNIKIFDEERVDENKRILAENFYKENNPLYKSSTNRPMSSRISGIKIRSEKNSYNDKEEFGEDYEDDIFNNDLLYKTQSVFVLNKNKVINDLDNNNIKKEKNEIKNEVKPIESKKLKDKIEEQNKIIYKLKMELENSFNLNKQYEKEIENYKNHLKEYKIYENCNKSNNDENIDEEKVEILNELERWKKEYFNLLEKSMNNKTKDTNIFSEDLFKNGKKIEKSDLHLNKEKIIERPKTANINSGLSRNFEKLYEEIKILKNKNNFGDMIDEEEYENEEENEDEEEKEEEKLEIKEDKNKIRNVDEEKEIEKENEDEIPDDEIEEMFRKSFMDIQKMKEDIKDMNETIDKNSKNNINMDNNTITIMNNKKIGNKQTLKPIIKKKDNIVNNKGNMLSINNKNIIENNKNPSQRYQGILYKLKK